MKKTIFIAIAILVVVLFSSYICWNENQRNLTEPEASPEPMVVPTPKPTLIPVNAPSPIDYILEEPVEEAVKEEPEIDIDSLYADELIYLAKTVYGEAGICSKTEQAAVVWCILNRVESPLCPDNIIDVVTQPEQFHGYSARFPASEEILELCTDVLSRWEREKNGEENVGRVLPKNYLWFYGDGRANHFTDDWRGGNKWDWSLTSPYEM